MFLYYKYVYIFVKQNTKYKFQKKLSKHSIKRKDMKIRIAPEFKTQMAKEFNTSKQNVKTALDYYNNSELAKKIRQRAKELLQNEANNVIA